MMGKAARAILYAIVAGETDPGQLANLALGRVHAPAAELERALMGKVRAHHRFLLGEHLQQIESLEAAIRRVSEESARRFTPPEPPEEGENSQDQPQRSTEAAEADPANEAARPLTWQEAVERIDQITGISILAAQGLLAEIGRDMGRFASAKHLASWVGVCPGNHESAGKRLSGKTRKGNRLRPSAADPECACRCPQQEHVFGGAVSPPCQSAGTEAGGHGGSPQHPGDHLPGPAGWRSVS